jgi:hypothetical protein
MKTPVQELLNYTTDLLHTFDSEQRVAMAVLDYLKTNKKAMLEKEKEVMCYFANKWDIESISFKIRSAESCFDETFKTKER